jgi:hypothetical protein
MNLGQVKWQARVLQHGLGRREGPIHNAWRYMAVVWKLTVCTLKSIGVISISAAEDIPNCEPSISVIINHVITNSMEQNPSWEANSTLS